MYNYLNVYFKFREDSCKHEKFVGDECIVTKNKMQKLLVKCLIKCYHLQSLLLTIMAGEIATAYNENVINIAHFTLSGPNDSFPTALWVLNLSLKMLKLLKVNKKKIKSP